MLYSYLLTRSEFKIETMPENASRDKKYAYSFYLDLILLILKLSGYNIGQNNFSTNFTAFNNSKFAKSLISNDEIKAIILKDNNKISYLDSTIVNLYNIILSSAAYKDYKKIKTPEIQDDIKFWTIILESIILKNNILIEQARQNPDFTIKGFEMGVDMAINTISEYQDNRTTLNEARKTLSTSLDKSYELYFSIFKLIIELTQMQDKRLDAAKNKYLPTADDLNPNTRFIENRFIKSIESNTEFNEYISKNPISWNDEPLFLKNLLEKILASNIYTIYMNDENNDYASDCSFWKKILKEIVFNDEEFIEMLETKSSYWNDDLHIIGTFVLKTIKHFANANGVNVNLIPQYKNAEDTEFGPILFFETINNYNKYLNYIEQYINDQWDSDRLAFMDTLIMTTAIAEIMKFPTIPIPVSLNEYIEIANSYSTPKSGQFINGILYSVINYLKSEGLLNK